MNKLIPFGKYIGKKYDTVLSDPSYLKWLKEQNWVKKKYPDFYSFISNNNITLRTNYHSSPTPNHNRLQNLFLNTLYRERLFYECFDKIIDSDKINVEFEGPFYWDIILEYKYRNCLCLSTSYYVFCEVKTSVGEEYPCILRKMKQQINCTENEYFRSNIITKYCLLIDNLNLISTSEEDFISVFKYSNIDVVFVHDILRI